MFAESTFSVRRSFLTASAVAAATALFLLAAGGRVLPSAEANGPANSVTDSPDRDAAVVPNAGQPPAKLVVHPLKQELLAQGVALVQFHTENLQIVPVFGPTAAAVSPRIGHLHVSLDDATWHWGHTSNDPVIVAPLPPGPHKILIELVDADHKVLAKEVISFDVPKQ